MSNREELTKLALGVGRAKGVRCELRLAVDPPPQQSTSEHLWDALLAVRVALGRLGECKQRSLADAEALGEFTRARVAAILAEDLLMVALRHRGVSFGSAGELKEPTRG